MPLRHGLKQPIAAGTNWRVNTAACLLRKRQAFPPEIQHSHPHIPMTYTIEALGQRVSTRAGEWEGRVRVEGAATVRLLADPVIGWHDVPLGALEWYCPGVGLAHLERHEPASSTFFSGGDLAMELMSWE